MDCQEKKLIPKVKCWNMESKTMMCVLHLDLVPPELGLKELGLKELGLNEA